MITNLLHIQPSELKFPFHVNKLSTCWLQITNRTDHNVAFKVKTTHPKKYCVRPNVGIVSPGCTCVIRVGLQAQKDVIQPTVLKDKFLIQSVIAPVGLSIDDITSELFRKERGNGLEEQKLRVVYVTANPPSPIPEGSEEECSPQASELENAELRNRLIDFFDSALMSTSECQDQFSEASNLASLFMLKETKTENGNEDQISPESESASKPEGQPNKDWDTVSKLIEELTLVILQNQELRHELEMKRKRAKRIWSSNSSILVALLACFMGLVVGYVIK